jgi:hypothetical protein
MRNVTAECAERARRPAPPPKALARATGAKADDGVRARDPQLGKPVTRQMAKRFLWRRAETTRLGTAGTGWTRVTKWRAFGAHGLLSVTFLNRLKCRLWQVRIEIRHSPRLRD